MKSPNPSWYAIIADEATDVNNNEKFNISIRWVGCEYTISEEPTGLAQLPDKFANTLVTAIGDVLRRCNLPLGMCRGQGYDGAANMQGVRNGVATQIQEEVYTISDPYSLSSTLSPVSFARIWQKVYSLGAALELVKTILKLVKLSQKRSTLFAQNLENYEGGVTLKPLCPNRWTVRTAAFNASADNGIDKRHHTRQYGKRANGVLSSLDEFDSVFGLQLGYLLFGAVEQLSRALQGKETTESGCYRCKSSQESL